MLALSQPATLTLSTFAPTSRSFFDRKSEFGRRLQLIRIAHKLAPKIEAACRNFHAEAASMEYDAHYHMYLGWQLHRQMSRYDRIVAELVAETGLEAYSVRNALAAGVGDDRLLFAND